MTPKTYQLPLNFEQILNLVLPSKSFEKLKHPIHASTLAGF